MPKPTSLLFVNQHYFPDVASTGQHLTDLLEHLASDGFDVEVFPSRGKYLAGSMEVPLRETRNGVKIWRVRHTTFGRGTHLGRLVDYASYYVQVLYRILTHGTRYDGVVFLTTPPLLVVIGWLARRLRGQRYGVWSMDLHPDVEIESGMVPRKGLLAKLLLWLNYRAGYRHADLIVDLGPYMKARIASHGVDAARCHTINVWNRKEEIEPQPREGNPLRATLKLEDRFVVMYSGNAGIVHDFSDILEAMRRLKDDPRVYFLFVGSGPRRREIETFAAQHDVRNFDYRDYFTRDELRYSLSVADVHLISLREGFVGCSVPGKLYGIMAAGRPALFVGPERCESADAVRDADCGATVEPGPEAADTIVRLLREWSAAPERVRAMGANGRQAFLAHYEREPNCEAWADVLRRTWAPDAAPRERAGAPRAASGVA